MAGRPAHVPTEDSRELVKLHTTVGTTQDMLAQIMGLDKKTLRKHYREELDFAMAQANATIGGALFNKAKGGDTASMIFWLKTRARWRETNNMELSVDASDRVADLFAQVATSGRRIGS